MLPRFLSWLLLFSLLNLISLNITYAASEEEREAAFLMQKMKAAIVKLGTGPKVRVEVKLKEDNTVNGYISESSNEAFVIIDSKTNQPITIQYFQVLDIKKIHGTRAIKIILIVGAVAFAVAWLLKSSSD